MKRKFILLVPVIIALLVLHTYLPYSRATTFIASIRSADPNRINILLSSDVSFRHYDGLSMVVRQFILQVHKLDR
jgi:hypothetical protein